MSASGYSITAISDVPLGGATPNLLSGLAGQKLREASRVTIFLTREVVEVLISVSIGGSEVLPSGPVNINTVVGSLPSTQDDKVVEVFAQANDEIIIAATNSNAADKEARALVKIVPIDDALINSAILIRGRAT